MSRFIILSHSSAHENVRLQKVEYDSDSPEERDSERPLIVNQEENCEYNDICDEMPDKSNLA